MGTKQMAQMAIAHLDNSVPPDAGNTEPIYVKYADEEGKKRHPPNNMFSNHHNHHHSTLTNLTGGIINCFLKKMYDVYFHFYSIFLSF